ncbi:SatD family protein [Belliella sp. DSM 107340]|uniref:SatD family protein n=1 Tax=Belliella calami TaxID=2923436 RepID=A0ABS9US51_9BACT|nr:SatD family protein [Belliella calami]MCH7399447.1 SatD family protein [Belliella calami]
MIAIIKGDIIASRKLLDQEKWLQPLKSLLSQWGTTPEQWELVWGDFFQLEIGDPQEALQKALEIKALIKKIEPKDAKKLLSTLDVRMSIGIGEKTFSGKRVSESNGPAFIYAGEKFEKLKKEKTNLAIQSQWQDFDNEINLYLRLAAKFMDSWSVSSAELAEIVLTSPNITQEEIGEILKIKQNSVSGRWNRSNIEEVLKIEKVFREKLQKLI